MAGRPCKICKLEKSHPEAHRLITEEINKPKGEPKIKSLLKILKERFSLNINTQNVHRHKGHSVKKQEKPDKEMKVYSEEGELIYTNIAEIIEDLEPKHKLFCEEYTNTFNHNATAAYMAVFDANHYGSAASQACKLLKNTNILLYIGHLVEERSKSLKISSSFVITGLMENYTRCMQAIPVLDRHGFETGEYIYNAVGANKALELIGKHLGMWDKKVETKDNQEIYQRIIEKLLLNQINPITAGLEMGKHNLPVPDALKIAMQKVDPKMIEPPKRIDSGDLDVNQLSDEELDQILLREEGI